MNDIKILFSNLLLLLFMFSHTHGWVQNNFSKTLSLNDNWLFRQADKDQWYKAQVPCSVQNTLIEKQHLPDPYYGTNEKDLQWVENFDWEFKKVFTLSAQEIAFHSAVLHFKGIDTFADIYLNGVKIQETENMFLAYQIPVKELLRKGENTLLIRFYAPVNKLKPQREASGFEYPAMNDHREEKVSVYARKAPYHFGWDWGMRIVQMGIWRPVELLFFNKAYVDDYFVAQNHITAQKASVENQIEIMALQPINATIEVRCTIDKQVFSHHQKVLLNKGKNTLTIPMLIENPKLWMPMGWGKQHRYDFSVKVLEGKHLICKKHQKIGLRSIRLLQEKDLRGESFTFEVNDKPLFAKGANYIPGEILTTRQDSLYYERLFENILAANMNMIRVWGGGIYENDYFYELADKYGILVWQDFMFACTPYPYDAHFLQNIEQEAIYNIKRLRNYACIALWCGNNEVEESINYWGFERIVPKEAYEGFKVGYKKIFRELLPSLLQKTDPTKSYIHSSPYIANWGRPQSLAFGDAHYWGVWYGREPFEILDKRVPRFMSEFGFQAFPEMKTIRTFATEQDFDIESEVMKVHQKSSTGNDAIKEYMDMYYRQVENFEDFVYVGLVMQGEGMKKGMLAHRRNRPFCMGSLYWQLNDSWPVVSWAGIDYYNNWKALHYKAREAFAPIAVDMYQNQQNQNTEFYVFSDELQDRTNVFLNIQLISFTGKVLKELNEVVNLQANTTQLLKSIPMYMLVNIELQKNHFVKVKLIDQNHQVIAQDHFFFLSPKNMNLPQTQIESSIAYTQGKCILTLRSSHLAKNVFIEIPLLGAKFSDNFFDLLPNEEKVIEIIHPQISNENQVPLKIKHLRDTYQ
ncbi:beta-mannosidase [Capnocytophaga catalasegens]|nr:glycoside hydrolase family 2 protein [Capnocytophaga catalasegens]